MTPSSRSWHETAVYKREQDLHHKLQELGKPTHLLAQGRTNFAQVSELSRGSVLQALSMERSGEGKKPLSCFSPLRREEPLLFCAREWHLVLLL